MTAHDPITAPAHYMAYNIQPIAITRHLGFCLGNMVKYVLRAPYKDGAIDLRKALRYLQWERQTPAPMLSVMAYREVEGACQYLIEGLRRDDEGSDSFLAEKDEVRGLQAVFLVDLDDYLQTGNYAYLDGMHREITALLVCMERGEK